MTNEGDRRRFRCTVCGYIMGEKADKCPKCSAPAAVFEPLDCEAPIFEGTQYECSICGFIYQGEEPPERCPECGVAGDSFEKKRTALKSKWVCTVCGMGVESKDAPERCPKCAAPQNMFTKKRPDGVPHMVCSICGYETVGDTPPERCPECGVGGELFEKI